MNTTTTDHRGTVVQWHDDRGFGFIRSQDGHQLFFHVRDWRGPAGARPRMGEAVRFEPIHVGGKGPRAMAVTPAASFPAAASPQRAEARRAAPGPRPRPRREQPPAAPGNTVIVLAWALMAAWAMAWGAAWWTGGLHGGVLLALAGLNLATFWLYWIDKYAARQGHWRTPEQTLHGLALLGGWPAAWWAQQLLRHKSTKAAFRQTYWVTVVINLLATAGVALAATGRLPAALAMLPR